MSATSAAYFPFDLPSMPHLISCSFIMIKYMCKVSICGSKTPLDKETLFHANQKEPQPFSAAIITNENPLWMTSTYPLDMPHYHHPKAVTYAAPTSTPPSAATPVAHAIKPSVPARRPTPAPAPVPASPPSQIEHILDPSSGVYLSNKGRVTIV